MASAADLPDPLTYEAWARSARRRRFLAIGLVVAVAIGHLGATALLIGLLTLKVHELGPLITSDLTVLVAGLTAATVLVRPRTGRWLREAVPRWGAPPLLAWPLTASSAALLLGELSAGSGRWAPGAAGLALQVAVALIVRRLGDRDPARALALGRAWDLAVNPVERAEWALRCGQPELALHAAAAMNRPWVGPRTLALLARCAPPPQRWAAALALIHGWPGTALAEGAVGEALLADGDDRSAEWLAAAIARAERAPFGFSQALERWRGGSSG